MFANKLLCMEGSALQKQLECLKKLFPDINCQGLATASNFRGFAVPKWQALFGTYNEAVLSILAILGQQPGNFFSKSLKSDLESKFGVLEKSSEAVRSLAQATTFDDVLIIGTNSQRIVHLGLFEVGVLLATCSEEMPEGNFFCSADVYQSPTTPGWVPYYRKTGGHIGVGVLPPCKLT